MIKRTLNNEYPTARKLATLRGKLFHLAALNHLIGAISWRDRSATQSRRWTRQARNELNWWLTTGLQDSRPLHSEHQEPTWFGASDASDEGY